MIPALLAAQMLAWRHSGFSVHNRVRVAGGDAQGRRSLAAYMLRAPFSLEKTTYDAASGTVLAAPIRNRLHPVLFRCRGVRCPASSRPRPGSWTLPLQLT